MPTFQDFALQGATRAVLAKMEITEPTPIQAEAIPVLLAGKDLVGKSATGSGKTLAYGIPLVERLARDRRVVQALVIVPTRELAVQVNTVLSKFAVSRKLTTALLVGGRPYGNQISALRYGAQIVVGTPGRIKDHLERGTLVLNHLKICVLDEADQMLDIGFAPIIEEILSTTSDTKQMALFSATMPEWIEKLQKKFLKDPVMVDITPAMGAESTIEQIAYQIPNDQKMAALCTLLTSAEGESSLIFGKTKFGVEKLGKQLSKLGFTVGTLHGNKSQSARDKVLTAFRQGQVQTLLATNVAARGLDIQGIYQVINYELPESSELFTHRIGRTGRMGKQGKAITLLVPADVSKWRRMARTLGQAVELRKLTIDQDAMIERPEAISEYLQDDEPVNAWQQPARGRGDFSGGQGRGDFSGGQGRGDFSRGQGRGDFSGGQRRRDFSGNQERNRQARPENDGYSKFQRLSKENDDNDTGMIRPTSWQPEGFTAPEGFTVPERRYVGKARNDRRATGKPARFNKAPGKPEAHSFGETEAQYRGARKKPTNAPPARGRRAAALERFASR
jgi:ATP-dependent RNA helicase DeaD